MTQVAIRTFIRTGRVRLWPAIFSTSPTILDMPSADPLVASADNFGLMMATRITKCP